MADNSINNNIVNTKSAVREGLDPTVQAGIVTDIILDSNHKFYSGPEDIGKIRYVGMSTSYGANNSFSWAKPLNTIFKSFPLINETVILIKSPGSKTSEVPGALRYSYMPIPIAAHSNINYNPVPSAATQGESDTESNQANNFAGNQSKSETEKEDLVWGQYFEDKGRDISRLKPFEGDSIWESRWGSSIRMGSTVKSEDIKEGPKGPGTKTNWSEKGNTGNETSKGDPICIVRVGESEEFKNTDDLYVENIDNEKTSFWLTSTQMINIKLASPRFGTYGISPKGTMAYASKYQPPLTPDYEGRQAIINSGRIILNAGDDDIFISSKTSVGIMSEGSIHIDSEEPIVLDSQKSIHIGGTSVEPALLGDTAVSLLIDLITYISVIDVATGVGPGLAGPSINGNLNSLFAKYGTGLEKLKCTIAKVE